MKEKKKKAETYQKLADFFSAELEENKDVRFLTLACELVNALKGSFSEMDWVGFYLFDKEKDTLYLGPYVPGVGACEEIKPGRGVCGRSFLEKRTLVVNDTSKEKNYIACSSSTKSEIVVPLLDSKGEVKAVLDIDSDTLSAFDDDDVRGLEALVWLLAKAK